MMEQNDMVEGGGGGREISKGDDSMIGRMDPYLFWLER